MKVTLVLGERNTKLPTALVKQLLKHAAQVELFETGRSGKNALDLVLAEKLGELKNADPKGYFHILSHDKDFDALVAYLKANGALAARHEALSTIPMLMNLEERIALLAGGFASNGATKPAKRQTLETHIQTIFARALSPEEIEATIRDLMKKKIVAMTGEEVSYPAAK